MKTLLALALGALSGCQKQKEPRPLASGQVVKTEVTVDGKGQNPRPRWIVDVPPLSFEGKWAGHSYQRVKVFNLSDTATYKAGRAITFHYQLVPNEQQTPWKTLYEWLSVPATPPGAEPLAELTLSDVQP